ncbi:hypothetical protein BJV74DRAFT_848439 [Russula compacta]|nr:hypothetical protein BJV74DRAFT_848439 [Russula compacta]
MVNYNDPLVLESDLVALRNFWHTINGLYIWEFVTTLDYEWDVIRGRRPYRWTIWIYSVTRIAALLGVALNFVGLDVTTPYNCQAWISIGIFSGYLAFSTASLLIVFRIIAIWNRNRAVVAISIGIWATNVVVMIQGLVRVRSTWSPLLQNCVELGIEKSKLNIIVTLVTDILLLIIMLVGLLYMGFDDGGKLNIGRLLWKQGLIWLLIATIAEVPPGVFILLNLNEPLNIIFQPFSVYVMAIAATRMYRGLADFVTRSTEVASDGHKKGGTQLTRTEWNVAVPISLTSNQTRVTVDTEYDRYPTSQMSQHESDISTARGTGGQPSDTGPPQGLSFGFDSDLESAREDRAPA